MTFDYERMVKIDPYNLDREWQQQPDYMLSCMNALAEARRELDRAKEAYDITVAEIDQNIRENSDKKPSEKAIENMILLEPDVQAAKKDLIEAKYNVSMLEAARAGLENKREALTNLVKLHGMSYFAEPEADIEARGQLEEMRQQAARDKVKIGKSQSTEQQPEQIRRKK